MSFLSLLEGVKKGDISILIPALVGLAAESICGTSMIYIVYSCISISTLFPRSDLALPPQLYMYGILTLKLLHSLYVLVCDYM